MSTTGPGQRTRPLNENALRQHVRIALERGYYRETSHAEHGHPERNLSVDDVIHGLERKDWVLIGDPSYDEQHRTWEYLIRTVDVEGRELHLKIAAVTADRRIEIITRW